MKIVFMVPATVLLLAAAVCPAEVGKKLPPVQGDAVPALAAFDRAVQRFMRERSIPAGALAVMKSGKIVLAHGYGYRDPHAGTLAGPETPFRLASISKPITLAGLLQLIRDGKLSLQTRAFVLLGTQPPPGMKMDRRLLDITIKDLIEHKGGWDRSKSGDPMFQSVKIARSLGKKSPPSANDIVHYMAGRPLDFAPGSQSVYSNFGYCVLGRVIEKVTGQRYIDYMKKAVFEPLKLTTVDLGRTLPELRNPAEPAYVHPGRGINVFDPAGKRVPYPDGTFCLEAMDAHGGLIASAPDLVRFLGAYWLDGTPRQGGKRSHAFNGSLPGTYTWALQRPDGVNIAVLFDQRADASGLPYDSIVHLLHKTADGVKHWP